MAAEWLADSWLHSSVTWLFSCVKVMQFWELGEFVSELEFVESGVCSPLCSNIGSRQSKLCKQVTCHSSLAWEMPSELG